MYPLRVRTTKLLPSCTRTSSGCQPAGAPDSNVITYWCRSSVTICLTAVDVSAGVFLLAFGVIRHFGPRHAFWLEIAALTGFALSALIWLVVAVATPVPVTVMDAAKQGARRVHDRLPEEIRQRLPEELRIKITGT